MAFPLRSTDRLASVIPTCLHNSFEVIPFFSGLHPSIYEFPYFLLSVFGNYCFSIIYNFIIARNYRLSIIFTTQYSNRFFRNYVIFPTFLIFLTLKNLLSATTYKRMAPKKIIRIVPFLQIIFSSMIHYAVLYSRLLHFRLLRQKQTQK